MIKDHFNNFQLTHGQEKALESLEEFLKNDLPIFLLKGYAGTGKTTILNGLVDFLEDSHRQFVLMAPTGRAAKVIRNITNREVYTIHRNIYKFDSIVEIDEENFYYNFKIAERVWGNDTIYIVDEASMISDTFNEGEFFRFGTGRLLNDFLTFTGILEPQSNAKVIFVGDPCQLPPVGSPHSLAFDREYLEGELQLRCNEVEMKDVVRQNAESGILRRAERLRKAITSEQFNFFDLRPNQKDIFKSSDLINEYLDKKGTKVIVANKNKTCHTINLRIRERLYGMEIPQLVQGDIVIVSRNNHFKQIFNGEFAVVNSVKDDLIQRTVYLKGKDPVHLTWRHVDLIFPDEEETRTVSGYVLMNFIQDENNTLPKLVAQALYVDFQKRNQHLKPKTKEFQESLIADEFFNCILLKYGHAVTCHKAQGGEWQNVFVIWDNFDDYPLFGPQKSAISYANSNFFRWSYTAVTRARSALYTINSPYFHPYKDMVLIKPEVKESLQILSGETEEIVEILVDEQVENDLKEFGLLEKDIPLQDHFLKVRNGVSKFNIKVSKWSQKQYEIWFTFEKEGKTASYKTYVNAKGVVRNDFTIIPSLSTDSGFNEELVKILGNLVPINAIRNSAGTILQKIEFEWEIAEKFPCTQQLFDDISGYLMDSGVSIDSIEHLSYKERYTFLSRGEKAVVDFTYNGRGSFSIVEFNKAKTSGEKLCFKLQEVFQSLKDQ